MRSKPPYTQLATHVWRVCVAGAIAWTLLQCINAPIQAQTKPTAEPTCSLFTEPQRFNTQTNDDGVITIGRQPNRPYHLILTNIRDTELSDIRSCVSDAFVTRSRFGRYILVGSFTRRREAESVRRTLQRAGYRTRVIYRRR